MKVCVVGAGVIGLSVANRIKQVAPSADVVIVADKFDRDTTSDGAAGICIPSADFFSVGGTNKSLLKKWMKSSFVHFDRIWKTSEASEAGIHASGGYELFDEPRETPLYADMVYDFRECSKSELQLFNKKYKRGFFAVTLMVECRFYLPWLMKKFISAGGRVEKRTIQSFKELGGEYDAVMNCCGIRSEVIAPDQQVYPVRGQMIRVKAPFVKFYVFGGSDRYIIPGKETVCIGGIKKFDDYSTEKDLEEQETLWKNAKELVPALEAAEEQWTWVGLRPARDPIRVEAETLQLSDGKSIYVVHNYGHGANGVSLSWGSAVDAVELLMKKSFQRSHEIDTVADRMSTAPTANTVTKAKL